MAYEIDNVVSSRLLDCGCPPDDPNCKCEELRQGRGIKDGVNVNVILGSGNTRYASMPKTVIDDSARFFSQYPQGAAPAQAPSNVQYIVIENPATGEKQVVEIPSVPIPGIEPELPEPIPGGGVTIPGIPGVFYPPTTKNVKINQMAQADYDANQKTCVEKFYPEFV